MIQAFKFSALQPGPHVLMFGAIHGNETCGTVALQRLVRDIQNSVVSLQRGRVTIIPVCNPEAYRQGKRQIDKNLNRVFAKIENPDCYESRLAQILTTYVDQADVLLDLHSFTAEGEPFVFLDYPRHPHHVAFARILGIKAMVQGWADLYTDPDPGYQGDTVQYALSQGKNAVVLECGQHADPRAPEVGYQAALRTLAYFGLMEDQAPAVTEPDLVTITAVVCKEKPGQFLQPWKHLDRLLQGTPIAQQENGMVLFAPHDMLILLPNKNVLPGAEWYYIGAMKE